VTKEVKVRRLLVPINCTPPTTLTLKSGKKLRVPTSSTLQQIWVWDWGRAESPTELQIKDIERRTECPYNQDLRATLMDVFAQANKNKVAFADLLYQRIETLQGQADPKAQAGDRGKRRGRR
jgi:hypothetical protein